MIKPPLCLLKVYCLCFNVRSNNIKRFIQYTIIPQIMLPKYFRLGVSIIKNYKVIDLIEAYLISYFAKKTFLTIYVTLELCIKIYISLS